MSDDIEDEDGGQDEAVKYNSQGTVREKLGCQRCMDVGVMLLQIRPA